MSLSEGTSSTKDLFDTISADRYAQKHSSYFEVYDRYLDKFRGKRPTVVEIGVQHGGSLLIWERFFDGDVDIVGLDILADCRKFAGGNVRIFIGDQSDPAFLDDVIAAVGQADIIIDDGSHIPYHQIKTFEVLFYKLLKDGGVYICEDCHTSYWPRYGGGLRKKGTFIEYAKRLCDQQNAWSSESRNLVVDAATRSIKSIAFYYSIVVFEKAAVEEPQLVEAGSAKLDLESAFKASGLARLILPLKRSATVQRLVRTNPVLWRLMRRFLNANQG
ncbi:class I SAM-dependent methyltransferase [Novosphingobium sp. FSW06-99]|uniref:class I SAM-dependent methyltransferase n=1 Tax=Novosphingobium sp. FSW06-99 TaxID=1739113 RepID=UPI000AAF1E06|nr:class I SAM-dependent methyltransferase [Novosphingobium sp. FSW06-99]